MTLIRINANKTLKGHSAIVLTTIPAPPEAIEAIRNQFPDLKLKLYLVPWGSSEIGGDFKEEDWKETTLFLTSTVLPTVEQAPHIQYVQLTSAGVNHLVSNPFFSDTNVPFCTANGVHGLDPIMLGI